jgi:hypothetical protein
LVIDPLERRSRLWPTTVAAVQALQARFPDLQGAESAVSPLEVAGEARSALAAIAAVSNP